MVEKFRKYQKIRNFLLLKKFREICKELIEKDQELLLLKSSESTRNQELFIARKVPRNMQKKSGTLIVEKFRKYQKSGTFYC